MKKGRRVNKSPHKDRNTSTHSYSMVSEMLLFFVWARGCLFSEADGDGASKRKKKRSSWESCMKEFILYVSPNWKPLAVPGLAHTYMAADQSLNSFQTLPISAFRY